MGNAWTQEEIRPLKLEGHPVRGVIAGRHSRTVVLLPGFPETHLAFRHHIPRLARHFQVVALDLPGFGRGEKGAAFRLSSAVEHVREVLDALGVSEAHFVGCGLGAAVALEFARCHPDRAKRLVISNGYVYPNPPVPWKLALSGRRWFARLAASLLTGRLPERIRSGCQRPVHWPDEVLADYSAPLQDQANRRRLLSALLGAERDLAVAWKQWGEVRARTLIVWGTKDPFLPVVMADLIHRQLTRSDLILLPECGHLPHEEMPELFGRLVRRFLRVKHSTNPAQQTLRFLEEAQSAA